MSLLGRLEDLSLTDIIQIVYLSRRSGVLEVINTTGRNTVLFRHGLVVNAASPCCLDCKIATAMGDAPCRAILSISLSGMVAAIRLKKSRLR